MATNQAETYGRTLHMSARIEIEQEAAQLGRILSLEPRCRWFESIKSTTRKTVRKRKKNRWS